jgi:hypothetical protein
MNLDIDEIFSPDEAALDLNSPKPLPKVKIWKRFIFFVKKHLKLTIITSLFVIVFAAIYSLTPVINIGQLRLANEGTAIKLSEGQSVNLKFADVSVKLNSFVKDTCPANMKCFGNGVNSVEYYITINGHKYATGSVSAADNTEFLVKTTKSDYSTYAEFTIAKNPDFKK